MLVTLFNARRVDGDRDRYLLLLKILARPQLRILSVGGDFSGLVGSSFVGAL